MQDFLSALCWTKFERDFDGFSKSSKLQNSHEIRVIA